MDQSLPGFAPEFMRIEIERQEDGYLSVSVLAAQDRRYISAADKGVYDHLSSGEAFDVLAAVLEVLWW